MAQVAVAKKYNPYTGKWEDVYGPTPSNQSSSGGGGGSGGGKKTTPKQEPAKTTPKSNPPKPTTPDKGNAHQGSGKDNKDKAEEKIREIEYDLEGSAQIHPDPRFSNNVEARDIVTFEGMGINFSGNYFLATVVHTINRSGYQMSFDVLRNNFVWKTSKEEEAPKPQPVPPKKEPEKKQRTYTVKKGDTLWAIAKRFYGKGSDYPKIFNANRDKIKDPHWIYPGQVFVIP